MSKPILTAGQLRDILATYPNNTPIRILDVEHSTSYEIDACSPFDDTPLDEDPDNFLTIDFENYDD